MTRGERTHKGKEMINRERNPKETPKIKYPRQINKARIFFYKQELKVNSLRTSPKESTFQLLEVILQFHRTGLRELFRTPFCIIA